MSQQSPMGLNQGQMNPWYSRMPCYARNQRKSIQITKGSCRRTKMGNRDKRSSFKSFKARFVYGICFLESFMPIILSEHPSYYLYFQFIKLKLHCMQSGIFACYNISQLQYDCIVLQVLQYKRKCGELDNSMNDKTKEIEKMQSEVSTFRSLHFYERNNQLVF